ncbi:hypothetical protein CFK41_14090 [Brachybacterium ginsengisoli]|uniref:Magnesium transporter CorA n=1 Tax=Brachybacterium ginsengisoli TaxID=1331682 RepID=A0A291GZY4_9MICO|nr:CorA family divalent cation transporter [Brachybacterium ginsengisoli]ATG55779.1 hypothetical protein CFK41_14090 [Brachybacterium ginsengisoli]
MEVIETVETLERHGDAPACVIATSADSDLARRAADEMGLDLHPDRPRPRRPHAVVDGEQADIVLAALGEDREQHLVQIRSSGQGLLVIAPEAGFELVRAGLDKAAAGHRAGTWPAAVAIALAVARRCDLVLDEIDDECQELEDRATGYASSPKRRTISRLRALLFRIQETQAAQQSMLAPDEELAQLLGPDQQTMLGRAATAFAANRSTATRLYAMLGDLLGEQDTLVSERLTLVATIFMPLTLATGFFGMNFGWMTDHIGSATAFVLLGVMVPAVLTAITLAVIHRMTRSS